MSRMVKINNNAININKLWNVINFEKPKDTHKEKAPSNKSPAPRKSTNMGVWAVGTLTPLFIRGS